MTRALIILACGVELTFAAELRVERFDRDPGWDAHNSRATTPEVRTVKQDFGYSAVARAGGNAGAMGGFISPAAEAAYYARKIPEQTFEDSLSASGRLVCGEGPFHVLVGFFSANSVNEWRTPNTIALRLAGRGKVFFAYVEYATSHWEAGGDSPGGFATVLNPETGRRDLKGFPTGPVVHAWSLRYDPVANGGHGRITVAMDNETSICNLDLGHKASGARFDRFGLLNVMKSADGGGEVWLDDVTINGDTEHFDSDPGWDQLRNRQTYRSTNVRPRFDFGYSPTQFARGANVGEMGGLVFRGDNRYPARMAYYGDRLDRLTLEKPLVASGQVALKRGVTDSTTLFGFFHSQHSMEVSPSQASGWPKCFVGIAIEGPSRRGFFFYPAYRVNGDTARNAGGDERPRILPDGAAHSWRFEYDPDAANQQGRIRVTLDEQAVNLDLGVGHKSSGAVFDRFGIVTTWIDGNGQQVYFDDLTYTAKQ